MLAELKAVLKSQDPQTQVSVAHGILGGHCMEIDPGAGLRHWEDQAASGGAPGKSALKAASRLRRWVLILQQIHRQPASSTEYPCPQPALTRSGRRPCCSAQTANNLERIRFPIFN